MHITGADRWSPFDPEWYKYAFDKYISTSDQLFNTDEIIKQGYHIPDTDQSKSSVFKQDAILNNSFNEPLLRETLKDIYMNNYHRLTASNHDGVKTFMWSGTFEDVKLIENTSYCEISLPTDTFIKSGSRDKYKLQQYYRKWLSISDIMNSDIFDWTYMLFINHRIYSDYVIRLDDQETTIRFKYKNMWITDNIPIYIIKFDTNFKFRTKIPVYHIKNQWNWTIPLDTLELYSNSNIRLQDKAILTFNRIEEGERNDDLLDLDILGDNLEFVKITNEGIDLSNLSRFNKNLIEYETDTYIWMSLICPKYLHEFPILLPTDNVFRPVDNDFVPIFIDLNGEHHYVKTNITSTNPNGDNTYVSMDENIEGREAEWINMIRPVVLSDRFNATTNDIYDDMKDEVRNLIRANTDVKDYSETLRNVIINEDDNNFIDELDNFKEIVDTAYDGYILFVNAHNITDTIDINEVYSNLNNLISQGYEEGIKSRVFSKFQSNIRPFWEGVLSFTSVIDELIHRYYIANILHNIKDPIVWEDPDLYKDQIRFTRPIDVNDFWMFEYDISDNVWRPTVLNITQHFPDVYTFEDSNNQEYTDRVFKVFFFYTDAPNVRKKSVEKVNPSASWTDDMDKFEIDKEGIFRNIFMEKFYWMAINSIYKGMLKSNAKWEVIEYIIDNESYERFNTLFIETMDPYFKIGLANYMKSDNYEFPFDYAVSKLDESMKQLFLGYKKVVNFQLYLEKTWIPSYFDCIHKIMEDYDYEKRLVRRPKSTFNTYRVIPLLQDISNGITTEINDIMKTIDHILELLMEESYQLNISYINKLKDLINESKNNIDSIIDYITSMDLNVYSNDDVNYLIESLNNYFSNINELKNQCSLIHTNAINHSTTSGKGLSANKMKALTEDQLSVIMNEMKSIMIDFDIDYFIKVTNNPDYLDDVDRVGDNSLIGIINHFNSIWPKNIQDDRDKVSVSCNQLNIAYKKNYSYTLTEVKNLIEIIDANRENIQLLKTDIVDYYKLKRKEYDDNLMNHLDTSLEMIQELSDKLHAYSDKYYELNNVVDEFRSELLNMKSYDISKYEEDNFFDVIDDNLTEILEALSYLDGSKHFKEANKALSIINFIFIKEDQEVIDPQTATDWFSYIAAEKTLFDLIANMSMEDNQYITTMESYRELVDLLIEYMDHVNDEFIPDDSLPTYGEVYTITDVELINQGLNHTVNDEVYVTGVGVYNVDSIDESDYNKATAISQLSDFRSTVFRDPMKSNSYNSITNGNGIGIMIKPISSDSINIIDDTPLKTYATRANNIIRLINRDIDIINPYNNTLVNITIERIKKIQSDFNELNDTYKDHMDSNNYNITNDMVIELSEFIPLLEEYVNSRNDNNLEKLLLSSNQLILNIDNVVETEPMINKTTYAYIRDQFTEKFDSLEAYYGNGSMWNDSIMLIDLLNDFIPHIDVIKTQVIDKFNPSGIKEALLIDQEEVRAYIDIMINAINHRIPNAITSIKDKLNTFIITDIDLVKDKWYRIESCIVAVKGQDYQIGDIIQIIPEVEVDVNGNPITDNADIILNDKILLRIIRIDENGGAVEASPIMNYALPYPIYGSRQTKALFGNGNDLIINLYTTEVFLTDTDIFLDTDSDIPNTDRFDENDMFKYQFDNIHHIPTQYEVYLSGKPTQSFIKKFKDDKDIIYINANDVYNLTNDCIDFKAEDYFIYRIQDIEILDEGCGYSLGQEIVVDADQVPLKFRVTKLSDDQYKSIEEVEMITNYTLFNGNDPESDLAITAYDTLNNIDDEFNNSEFDQTNEKIIELDYVNTEAEEDEDPIGEHKIRLEYWKWLGINKDESRDRNLLFMQPYITEADVHGDPDYKWYLGSRIDNSYTGDSSNIWNGIMCIIPPTDGLIPDADRLPNNRLDLDKFKIEYQAIATENIHNTTDQDVYKVPFTNADLTVDTYADIPKTIEDWPDGYLGKTVMVTRDETNGNHRMLYTVKAYMLNGRLSYYIPQIADIRWIKFDIKWNKSDCHTDAPTLKQQYPDADWYNASSYRDIQYKIIDMQYEQKYVPVYNNTTYIHDLSMKDLAVYNYTKHRWEDLSDSDKWLLTIMDDGFILSYIYNGTFAYDMKLFLCKSCDAQKRNEALKRNAKFKIKSIIFDEVLKKRRLKSVNTGKDLRIRKLYPFYQEMDYKVDSNNNRELFFKINDYLHFQNELHLEDIMVFNKTAGYYMDILDSSLFEVAFRYETDITGTESNTRYEVFAPDGISDPGSNFVEGDVWAWNEEYQIHIFGYVTVDDVGRITKFTPTHCVNKPDKTIRLEFQIYQYSSNRGYQKGRVIIDFFHNENEFIEYDGWIHNVTNKLAVLPKMFKIIFKGNVDMVYDFRISIEKSSNVWRFTKNQWEIMPTFEIPDVKLNDNHIYAVTKKGRMPLINPATGRHSLKVVYDQDTNITKVTFNSIYKKYEVLEIHSTPYPMRSVYTKRRIPSDGYIDIAGYINKPLNKKYFEFWVNGRLLNDEVTIISPTKIFLHGLKSLRNLEIIEINRDSNEYFSDGFLSVQKSDYGNPYPKWDFETYLDHTLSGTLLGNNFTPSEQAELLKPVWYQVSEDDINYKDYPENVDIEEDILQYIDDNADMRELTAIPFQFAILNIPTIEGTSIASMELNLQQLGLLPITNDMITDMLDEEWSEEISKGLINQHSIITDDDWFGKAVTMYDENGEPVHDLNTAIYKIVDSSLIRVNVASKIARIVKSPDEVTEDYFK